MPVRADVPVVSVATGAGVMGARRQGDKKKISTTVYFEPDARDSLNALADRMHIPTAELVRLGIEAVLNVERLVGELPTYQTLRNVLGLAAGSAVRS